VVKNKFDFFFNEEKNKFGLFFHKVASFSVNKHGEEGDLANLK
jgi:hypothetical protein